MIGIIMFGIFHWLGTSNEYNIATETNTDPNATKKSIVKTLTRFTKNQNNFFILFSIQQSQNYHHDALPVL